MLMMMASIAEMRDGPVRVIWRIECWVIDIGGSNGASASWKMTRVVVVELATSMTWLLLGCLTSVIVPPVTFSSFNAREE